MADCLPYYCYDFDPYPGNVDCETKQFYLSGISAIGLLKCGVTVTDPSSAVEVQGLIDTGDMVIITGIKAGLDEPSALTIDPLTACGSAVTVNYDRTASFSNGKVSQEVVSWFNGIKMNVFGGALLYECAEDRVSYVTETIQMNAARSMDNTNATAQVILGGLAWRSLNDPIPYPAPTGIFSA